MNIPDFACGYVLGILSGIGLGLVALSLLLPKPTKFGDKP